MQHQQSCPSVTKMNQEAFKDILEPRRQELSNLFWVSRKLETVLSYKQIKRPKPETHKLEVMSSPRIREIIKKLSTEYGKPEEVLEKAVKFILDEIGFNKQLKTIRWLGLALTKINQKMYTGIHVNEDNINRLKSAMGTCPVVFAPSHRSYADFILMSYICFTYDIEIPAIAAGMDFHGMWGMGSVLRDTGAFFMRRSFNDDKLYWETFKQYIHQIVTRGDLPIEFFIEGTRSRSCKSLIPKFGLLSMVLKPLFTGEVPDILIVPINISYDRVLEEKLFAFELLGIPKPKESTSGLLKSLSIIKENYGSIYVDFAKPISAKEYFGEKLNRLSHSIGPLHNQILDSEDRELVTDLGYEILCIQRQHAVLVPFNLLAVLLSTTNVSSSSVATEMNWLREILETLGARISSVNIEDALNAHKGLAEITNSGSIKLIENDINLDNIDNKKMKAHRLSNETMTNIVPHIMLQLYVNPTLHYFVDSCIVNIGFLTFVQAKKICIDEMFQIFQLLRTIFSFEFAFYHKNDEMAFEETIQKLKQLNVIEVINNSYILRGSNEKLQSILIKLFNPFIAAYSFASHIIQAMSKINFIEHTAILTETQKRLESSFVTNSNIHPYAMNLDTLSICLQSLSSFGALKKVKRDNKLTYDVNFEKLDLISSKLNMIAAKCYKNFVNDTIPGSKNFVSKL